MTALKKLRMVILFIMIATLTQTQADMSITDSHKYLVHPGLISEDLQKPKFYEKVYPLVFQFNLTSYIASALEKANDKLLNEVSDYAFDQKLVGFLNDISSSIVPKDINWTMNPSCNEIGLSFHSFFTEISALKDHLQYLRDCFSSDERDTEDYLRVLEPPESFRDLVLQTEYPQIQMLEDALEDCRKKQIPKSLLSFLDFEANFITANKNLVKANWNTTFEGRHEDLSSYFYRPYLTDCTLSDGAMFVRVLIPVVRNSHVQALALSKFKPVPFFYHLKNQDFICQVEEFDDNFNYLVNTVDKIAFKSNCKPNELCPFNENAISVGKISLCASAQANESKADFIKYCRFACKESTRFLERPIVHKFGRNEFLMLGHIPNNMSVQCPLNATNPDLSTPVSPNTLTVELQIPCGCMIKAPRILYELDGTCNPDIVETKSQFLLPLAWLTNTCLINSEDFTMHMNVSFYRKVEDDILRNAKETRGVSNLIQSDDDTDENLFEDMKHRSSSSRLPVALAFMIFTILTLVICCIVSHKRRSSLRVPLRGSPKPEFIASFHR